MIHISSTRIAAVLRRYGTAGMMHLAERRQNHAAGHNILVLMHDLRPLRHPDLPDHVIAAEGVMMAPTAHPPRPGSRLVVGSAQWVVETVTPIDAVKQSAPQQIFEVQLSQAPGR